MTSGFYDITSKTLGRGHYGVVKLGRHCLTGEPVAMKIIEKSKLNKDSLNQLGTEIGILFRLSEYEHPNVLKLYQTIDTEDKLYLVTEYCGPHACDLHDYLLKKHRRDGLAQREAQIFFVQICSSISYCHSMGIVHRDLKPENILVTDYRHMLINTSDKSTPMNTNDLQYPLLKLIDFGFANQWYPDEKMRTSCGTLAYSAPELLLGEAYDGTKVDVWGLGLMLYILLYGGNPFMQRNDNETLTKILDCSFATPLKENVDKDAVELLKSLIKRNPDSRLSLDAIERHKWFSGVPKSSSNLALKQPIKLDHSSSNNNKQLLPLKLNPITSPLPSISESGPLRNINRSCDDEHLSLERHKSENSAITNYSRTRSLSITRIHHKPKQRQLLFETKSSINLGKLGQNVTSISPVSRQSTRTSPLYRPTSPDIGGWAFSLSEEEKNLHELVIQEMFRLSKLIKSKSGIEASLKSARFSHRLFNHNSIQPTQPNKRKVSTGLIRKLIQTKQNPVFSNAIQTENASSFELDNLKASQENNAIDDRMGAVNLKLNNDYIYATYQLIRDKSLRFKHHKPCREAVPTTPTGMGKEQAITATTTLMGPATRTTTTTAAHNSLEISMAFALPLARKCSLVSEESACSNDTSENQ